MPNNHLTRRRFMVAGLGAVLAACAGGTGDSDDVAAPAQSPSPTDPSPNRTPSADASPSTSPTSNGTYDPASSPTNTDLPTGIKPVRIEIPAIDVDVECMDVNITAEEVEVPDFGLAGWWVQTRKPGEIGPAVIGGHVDTKEGPDVFFRLKDMRPGDEVIVTDEAGESRTFTATDEPLQVDKQERPPEVFGFTEGKPQLRLITCGGEFNPTIGHYTDNIVVFTEDTTFEA